MKATVPNFRTLWSFCAGQAELADLAGAAGNPSLAANDLPVPNLTRQDRRQIRYYGDNDLRGQLLPVSAFLFAFAVEASEMHLERRLPRRRAS
jgi:hypothetical protein